jgi:hypothetical protein
MKETSVLITEALVDYLNDQEDGENSKGLRKNDI